MAVQRAKTRCSPDDVATAFCRQTRHATAADGGAASRAATAEPRGALASSLLRGAPASVGRLSDASWPLQALTLACPALACAAVRGFAAGTYLDKAQVTERVLSVVKNFAKVDPAKARRRSA